MVRAKHKKRGWKKGALCLFAVGVLGAAVFAGMSLLGDTSSPWHYTGGSKSQKSGKSSDNPLFNRRLYVDPERDVVKLAANYRQQGKKTEAELAERIAKQPEAVWLVGPTTGDPTASKDIAEITRTSKEAAAQSAVPLYQLYAIPRRDACASYSQGGFATTKEYIAWLDQILKALQSDAVFSVEADALAHTVNSGCMTAAQATERYQLLSATLKRLKANRRVVAAYLDAGHPDWFPDPKVLVAPLQKAGIDNARGIAVNVSNFVANPKAVEWTQKLVGHLDGKKGAIIDTSRNGKGTPPASVTGDARWCNPAGRGLGSRPSTNVSQSSIDAYVWIKTVGESDGACFGNPAAGVFMPAMALELARNATP